MKKLIAMCAVALFVIISDAAEVSAEHVLCYSEGGVEYYIDTEYIYDSRPYYFVDVVWRKADFGQPVVGLNRITWRFNRDEGTLWYENCNGTGKVYDSEFATAVYLKMKENLHLAKRGAPSGFRGYRR